MDVSAIASLSTAMSSSKLGNDVATSVLKKTLDIQEQTAMQLLQALPQAAASNPPHLGNRIDVQA